MTRLFIYIFVSLALTAGAAWLIALPGTMTIEMAGYRLQPGLGTAAVFALIVIILCIAIWAIIRRILEAPKRLAKAAARRRRDLGTEALSDGFIALQAGDLKKARQLATEAQTRLPENAAARLLEARAELGLGELGPAREHYRALISNPKTALAALSGLFEQARAQDRNDVALTFARKAVEMTKGSANTQSIAWAHNALFDDVTMAADWEAALEMVDAKATPDKASRAKKRRQRTVLRTAIAADAETSDPNAALENAQAALKLTPDFVPAALIAARVHINRAEVRKAQSLLRHVWRETGHPQVALLFTNAQSGSSAIDRLKRAKDIVGAQPQSTAAAMVLARAAMDAYEWTIARNALAMALENEPTAGVCALMAEIEEGENADQGKARAWLARAVRAPRDPIWVADGVTSETWEPVSPLTGKLDAFVWKQPLAAKSVENLDAPTNPTLELVDAGPPKQAAPAPEAAEAKPLASPPQPD